MDPTQWMASFREMHEQAKANKLSATERVRYMALRGELARSLVAAQGMTLPAGQDARRYFRVAQLLPIEINRLYKSVTRDISRSGFSAILETSTLKTGDRISFTLTVARGEDVTGEAKVVSSIRQAAGSRISFSIEHMSEANSERLEVALYDAVLARFK